MKMFRKRRRGGFVAEFEASEAELIVNLVAQVLTLLEDRNGSPESAPDPLARMVGMDGPMHAPEDPVLARLLPDAYRDDADDATEFRRFTEQTISDAKSANGHALIASLREAGLEPGVTDAIEVELSEELAWQWLKALTDVRLSLATRLGIEVEGDLQRLIESDDEAHAVMADIYEWLGHVQESLVYAMDR